MAVRGAGRPSTFTEETADAICGALVEGESLVDICSLTKMPNRRTVYRWMDEHPDFASRCARAREGQADFMDHRILQVANACTPETAQSDKVKISAYQWRAMKLAPKRYGDRMLNEHTGKDGGPIEHRDVGGLSDAELEAIAAGKAS